MNYSTYRFTLDIHKTKSQVSIPVLFQDTGAQIFINLTDGGKPYHIAEGCKAVLYGRKPLFHADTGKYDTLLEDCEVIDGGTRIRYAFSDQTTTQLGSVACEIRLYSKDGKLLTTPAFEILVEARVIEDDEIIESADERTALDRVFESEMAREEAERERQANEENRQAMMVEKIKELAVLTSPEGGDEQVIRGDIRIEGNITVGGRYIVTDADGKTSGLVAVTGDVVNTDFYNAYPAVAIMFDASDKVARHGTGILRHFLTENSTDFIFDAGQGLPIASRGNTLTDGHIVKYDAQSKAFVDSGSALDDFVKANETSQQFIKGDLEVNTLFTDSPYIVCQSKGQSDWAYLVFPDGEKYYGAEEFVQDAYVIAFDRSTKTVRLGAAILYFKANGEINSVVFGYKGLSDRENFAQAIATRADTIGDKHIAVWDAENSMFVDSGRSAETLANEVMAQLTGGAPEALDTLKELADALGSDPNFASTVLTKIGALESAMGDVSTALDEIIALGEFYTGATFDELHEYALNVAKGGSQ